jgi:hypothetical protein
MTKTESIESRIAELAGNSDDILALLEALKDATRADMKADVLTDLEDLQATDTAMDAYELIESNY